MDLGDDPALDFLLDQDVGSVTLCDSSWPPVYNLTPYKRMPNFGDSETGLSQPLLSLSEEQMDSSQQDATLPSAVRSTSTSSPASKPVELQLAAMEEQGILSGDHPAGPDEEDSPYTGPASDPGRPPVLGLWSEIGEACGEPGIRICHQCRRKFSYARWLRVHARQHFFNVFCPCGEYSYQRDYVLIHQRISRCHTGYAFAVDQATFPEFWDLVMPHVVDPRRRATLAQGFPACRPV